MVQALIFLDEEANKIVIKYSEKNKISKNQAIINIIKDSNKRLR